MKTTLFFLFLALSSCSKNNDTPQTPQDQLPQITTIGANTAGCIINGKILIPKNGEQQFGGSPKYGLSTGAGINFNEPIIGDDYSYIKIANLKDKGGDNIYIHMNDMTMGLGTYYVGQSNGELYMDGPSNPHIIANIFDGVNLGKTYYSGPNAGAVTFTRFDYTNGVYSGIFNVALYNKDNHADIIQVSDGRFDIKIATLNQ